MEAMHAAGLITVEDRFGAHKFLGVACLLHFGFRFLHFGEQDMLFDGSATTGASLALHVLLSMSSLQFKIPRRRIKDGSRLWPEARWHAILFATRHLACMLLYWYERRYGAQPLLGVNIFIVFINLGLADLVNRVYSDCHSNYVRDMQTSPWIKYLFSSVQIGGTVYCLIGQRRFSFHFLAVFVIQFSAFMMTLRRKNLMSHTTWVSVYACILLYGGVVAYVDLVQYELWNMVVLTNLCTVLRCVMGLNKYVLWAGVSTFLALWHKTGVESEYGSMSLLPGWPALIGFSYSVWIFGCLYKVGAVKLFGLANAV